MKLLSPRSGFRVKTTLQTEQSIKLIMQNVFEKAPEWHN